MKICIYGAGAMGGYIAALLARTGVDVTCIARGPHLAAMKANGLKLLYNNEEIVVHPFCTDDPAKAGHQDYVFLALKAPSVPKIVDQLGPLIGPDTSVVTAANGIPWWYFHKLPGEYEGRRIESVDPGGVQWTTIGPERVIGCVMWGGCEIVEPGVIKHLHGDRNPLGEPDGSRTPRVEALSKAMVAAGMKSPVRPRIRDEIWMKLWGNLSFNPVSALTHGTLGQIYNDPGQNAVVRRMMEEAQAIAQKLGTKFSMTVQDRMDAVLPLHDHKTSMLQDVEAKRPMEIDALLGSVAELGRITGLPTPTIDTVHALLVGKAKTLGVYP
jgi:2-dehydropantoate 2-reductase